MTDFQQEFRFYCRNKHCRSKLPTPVSNPREAFCTKGCYGSFYRSHCLICEEPLKRKNEQQKVCGKRKCLSVLRQLKTADSALGRYFTHSLSEAPQEVPSFIDSKTAPATPVAKASAWLPRGLARPGHGKPAWRWERLCAADGSEREDDDWHLLNRDGRMAVRVRQEGSGYWVARPRIVPEPPIESFKDACRRAVSAAMATLEPWPETERHPVHPGMTASQFKATCRDWQRKYPDLSDEEIERRVVGILKPSQTDCAIKRHDPPVNVIGGYRFPNAPVVDTGVSDPVALSDAIVPDPESPGLYRVRLPNGSLLEVRLPDGTMVGMNLSRAKDAARSYDVAAHVAPPKLEPVTTGVAAPPVTAARSPAHAIPDDLSIPNFLRRPLMQPEPDRLAA